MAATEPAYPAYIHHTATAYGLSQDSVGSHRDLHGAAHIWFDVDRSMDIRIQLEPLEPDTPGTHAARLERDRQGLVRLAQLAGQLAQEIEEIQSRGRR
jgi:hypothetical protein